MDGLRYPAACVHGPVIDLDLNRTGLEPLYHCSGQIEWKSSTSEAEVGSASIEAELANGRIDGGGIRVWFMVWIDKG